MLFSILLVLSVKNYKPVIILSIRFGSKADTQIVALSATKICYQKPIVAVSPIYDNCLITISYINLCLYALWGGPILSSGTI